jgi:GTPase SAR1 family protein
VYFDMPGKERHHKYVHKYVTGSTALIFLFDLTRKSTFEHIEQWLAECGPDRGVDAPIRILVGNKLDLQTSKKAAGASVSKVEAIAFARKHNMEYFETCSVGEAPSIVSVFDHLFK